MSHKVVTAAPLSRRLCGGGGAWQRGGLASGCSSSSDNQARRASGWGLGLHLYWAGCEACAAIKFSEFIRACDGLANWVQGLEQSPLNPGAKGLADGAGADEREMCPCIP